LANKIVSVTTELTGESEFDGLSVARRPELLSEAIKKKTNLLDGQMRSVPACVRLPRTTKSREKKEIFFSRLLVIGATGFEPATF
jgi:hypothetical protein